MTDGHCTREVDVGDGVKEGLPTEQQETVRPRRGNWRLEMGNEIRWRASNCFASDALPKRDSRWSAIWPPRVPPSGGPGGFCRSPPSIDAAG